ncbi:MAG TPA: hypothetical protein VF250_00610, partial [Conexibacter sp.]
VENAREDAIGALAHGQWGVLTAVVRRMLLRACLALLSAHGVDPLPSQEEACARIAELPSVDRAVARDTIALEHSIAIDGPSAGRELLTAVERLVVRLRAAMGAASFPQSFGDAEGWRATLETFYDWVRLGANLDADFPLEDLRDVLLSVDQRRGPTATAAGPRA